MLFSGVNVQLLFAVVLIIAATTTTDLKRGVPCVTPNQENSSCVPLNECAVLYNAVFNPTTETIAFLKNSKCGSNTTLVCCGTSAYPKNPPPPQAKKIQLSVLSDDTVCGMHEFASYKISGGVTADFLEFPWVAALEYKSKFSNTTGIRCGGSVINDRYVLTAAHCTGHIEFELIKVWLGATNITTDDNCMYYPTGNLECINSIQKYNVEIPIVHPRYLHFKKTNDIALLRLEKNIIFTHYIRPICLLSSDSSASRSGTYLTVAGWGVTEDHKPSDIKLKVDVPVQDDSICNEFLVMQERMVDSNQLCVGGETGKDSCEGDSGGPLMTNFKNAEKKTQWYQEGLVSYGVGCADNKRPTIYTRVSKYEGWIATQIYLLDINLKKSDPCTTPNGKSGTCVPLSHCKLVFNAAATRNQSARNFAAESYCGYDNETLVCCESPGPAIVPNFETKALPAKSVCGVVKEEPRIYGSEIADIGEFPWMAGVEYKSLVDGKKSGIKCGGSLISNRYVLTTAQCLIFREYEPINVWLGDWKFSTDPDCKELLANIESADPVQKIPVKETIQHPFYNPLTLYNNIGLILLENEIQFTDYISPICLTFPNLPSPKLGTVMTVTGWGTTGNRRKTSDVLLKVEIPLVSNEECNEKLKDRNVIIGLQQLCAGGEGNKGSCGGDSGGALARTYQDTTSGKLQWYQEGVTSFGSGCGPVGYSDVYSRVSSYMDWLINIISED